MTRAIGDTTSTCGTCSFWMHDPGADGIHPTRLGYCNWISVPAWVTKHIPNDAAHRKMREHDGRECWQHNKRVP